eukprot:scaffold51625_cov50-Cyclotella_meneghiniana.AAC.1
MGIRGAAAADYYSLSLSVDGGAVQGPSSNCRAKEVVNQYSNKFKKLDKQCAADIVGNGDNGNGIVGPFESAQKVHRRTGDTSCCRAIWRN